MTGGSYSKTRWIFMAVAFALVTLVAATIVHNIFRGPYFVNYAVGSRLTFWVGPISSTIPFVLLACIFLTHRVISHVRRSTPFSSYTGMTIAWCAMMAFTIFLVGQEPGDKLSSTMALAIGLTPFFYLPIMCIAYVIAITLVAIARCWQTKKIENSHSPDAEGQDKSR